VLVDGRLCSIAHSSRRTREACELGINTLPEARRKGYALAATVAWSAAIVQEGLTPIYSALATNTPSLNLACAAGYREIARAVTLE
jgi:predicted GNAT family acetyltransferase